MPHPTNQMMPPHMPPRPQDHMMPQHPPIPSGPGPRGRMGLPPHRPPAPQPGPNYMTPPRNQGPMMVPQHGFMPPNIPYHMGPPPHGRPLHSRFDRPPQARPEYMSPPPGRPIPHGHMPYPGHGGPRPMPVRMGVPMGAPQHFIPRSGVGMSQRPPYGGFPGQGFPQPPELGMVANRTMPHRTMVAHPERDVEGVSGMDDEMEIEETGVTTESDIPPEAVSGKPWANSKSVTGSTEVKKADVPEPEVHTSQSQEPVLASEATSSDGVTSEGPPPPQPPTTADEEVTMSAGHTETEESNDKVVSDGEKHHEENQLRGNEQLTLQGEKEIDCSSSEGRDGNAGGAQDEGGDQHSKDDPYIEVVADTCTSETQSK